MRTTWVSTPTLMNGPLNGVHRMQSEMTRLNTEITTGRMSDVGLNFGAATGRNVTLHVDLQSLDTVADSANRGATRLTQTQAALDGMRTSANTFLDSLLSSMQSGSSPGVIQQSAASALNGFIAGANASDGQDYLFGGINSAVPPLAAYDAGPKAAVDAAFLAKFGVTQDDPGAASISASDMSDFLDNEFSALFADPAWGATWSQASDQTMSTRVGASGTISTSVSANQPAMRKLAMVYTMVADLGIDKLGADARQVVFDHARSLASDGIGDLTNLQAGVGSSQNDLKDATQRLTLQKEIIEQHLSGLEGVDPAEAKVKFDSLSTQIEMSYSLTSKLLQMSLLNYA